MSTPTPPAPTPPRFINPADIFTPTGYTHVVEAHGSRIIFISGQVPLNVEGELVGAGDLRAQTEQVFKNLQIALEAVGATFADVMKLNYYLVDASQLEMVREVRNQYVSKATPPASTAVEVRRLYREDVLIEIEATAVLP